MDAVQLGPIVISAPRFIAGVALLVLVVLAEVGVRLAKRRRARSEPHAVGEAAPVASDAGWAWNAAAAVFIGARLGFVFLNFSYFATNPLAVFMVWQGGFSPWWGVAAGGIVFAWYVYRQQVNLRQAGLPAVAALAVWLVVPYVADRLDNRVITLPVAEFQRLDGEKFVFPADPDRPVILNLWATWCGPCQRELPHLAQAAVDWPGVDIIYLNQGESPGQITGYLLEHPGVDLGSVLLDPGQRTGMAMGSFGLPTTYFFLAGGEHFRTQVGEISGPALTREIERLVRVSGQ